MSLTKQPYSCQYCGNKFAKEKTLFVHVCEQKRRALARTERHVVLAYDTYVRWYKLNMNSLTAPSYDEFARSAYYNGFVKFGSFVSNVNPLYPDKFIEFVVRSGVKLDHWCRDELYDKYVIHFVKNEPVEVALERSITHMVSWGEDNNAAWNHYFIYVSVSRACFDVKDGKISPWVLLNSKNGQELLKKFDDTQLAAINAIMDVPFWLSKFKRLSADTALAKQVIKESNL